MSRKNEMRMTGFWRHFEESVYDCTGKQQISTLNSHVATTQTRQREEPDQRRSSGMLTLTKTAQTEEGDQDESTRQYRAIPFVAVSGTQTLTAQREEPDQDEGTQAYSAFPNCQALS